jgi:hypothetical protein
MEELGEVGSASSAEGEMDLNGLDEFGRGEVGLESGGRIEVAVLVLAPDGRGDGLPACASLTANANVSIPRSYSRRR